MVIKSFNSDTINMQLTIYTNNLALVNETRQIPKNKDAKTIEYYDISHYLDESSVLINGGDIAEINFTYECNKGTENCLNTTGDSHIITSMMIFFNTLSCKHIETYYLTPDIMWNASYTLVLSESDLIWNSWINIKNTSGITYNNTTIKCVSGQINTLTDGAVPLYKATLSAAPSSEGISQEQFEDYYVYLLNDKYTLKNNSTKRINNSIISGIKYDKLYDFGYYDNNAKIILKIDNAKDNNLGFPITGGTVDVYTPVDENLELLGRSRMNNTPTDATISLDIGKAFDVTCERKVIDYKKDANSEYKEIEFVINNRKSEAIPIKICYPIFNAYEIIFSSDPYEKNSEGNPCYELVVNGNEIKTIKFGYKINK